LVILILSFIFLLSMLVCSIFLGKAIVRRKRSSQSVWFLVIPFSLIIILSLVVGLGFVGNQFFLQQVIDHAQLSEQKMAQSQIQTEELANYADCILSAESEDAVKKCEEGMDPELLERLKNKSQLPIATEYENPLGGEKVQQSECVQKFNACSDECYKLSAEEQHACYAKCEEKYSCR